MVGLVAVLIVFDRYRHCKVTPVMGSYRGVHSGV